MGRSKSADKGMKTFDLVVIGSGPAGEKAAVKAAYFGYNVALIEKEDHFGGAGVQTGTLPSKALKETVLYLSGKYHKGIFGIDKELGHKAGLNDFMYRKNVVMRSVEASVKLNLLNHKITILAGEAEFIDQHRIRINGNLEQIVYGENIIVATGSYPFHPSNIPFDGIRVHDSDTILNIKRFPKSLCVLGAGVIGCEYATIFAAMGIKTFIVNDKDKILGFLDHEISQTLVSQMQMDGITILFNRSVEYLELPESNEEDIRVKLATGEILHVDMFLYAAGRSGYTQTLKCENAGILTGERQTILVNNKFQTNIPHIYAVGDVIGFPALASTSMDQGRVAVAHIFKTGDLHSLTEVFPYGIYTVPEVSMVGITETSVKAQGINYVLGYSYYRDITRGKIMADKDQGFLKIIVEKETKIVLGVHIIGNIATELIHYGMLLVKDKKTLEEVIATVFNYPSFHDLYKYASYDALGSLSGRKIKKAGEELMLE
jgi:NAD(P) transhydrogenase